MKTLARLLASTMCLTFTLSRVSRQASSNILANASASIMSLMSPLRRSASSAAMILPATSPPSRASSLYVIENKLDLSGCPDCGVLGKGRQPPDNGDPGEWKGLGLDG